MEKEPLKKKSAREIAKENAKNFLKGQLRVIRFKSQNDFDKWHTKTCNELITNYKGAWTIKDNHLSLMVMCRSG